MLIPSQIAIIAAAALFTTGGALAQMAPGHHHNHGSQGHEAMMRQGMGGGRGPVAMLTTRDANSAADMGVAMNLIHENTKIRRSVTRLPDGIKTLTESDDPQIAQEIKAHVARMSSRLQEGKEFNVFSTTLPVIFDNAKNIQSTLEFTTKGVIATRRSADPKVVAALQAHADEVTELVKEGPVAFHRGLDARAAMGPAGPRGASKGSAAPAIK